MQVTRQRNRQEHNDFELFEVLKESTIMTVTDMLGRLNFANDNYLFLIGKSREETFGEPHTMFGSSVHKNPIYKELWSTIKKGKTWTGILPNINTESETRWLNTTITPIKNQSGSVVKYVSTYSDISRIYEENNKFSVLKSEHNSFIESIPELVLSVNKSGRIIAVNRAIGETDPENVIGSYVYGFVNPLYHSLLRDNIAAVFNGATRKQLETKEFDVNGEELFYLSTIGPAFNKSGKITAATIATRDITNLGGNSSLNRDNNIYQSIFKSIDVRIIVVANEKGIISEWNKGAELAFGYEESEIIGCHLTQLMARQFRQKSMKELLGAVNKLKVRKIQETIEMRGLKKNGEEFPIEFSLIKWKTGKRSQYCAMMLDITKRNNVEKNLKTKIRDLELLLYRSSQELKSPFSFAEEVINRIKDEDVNRNFEKLLFLLDNSIKKGKETAENMAIGSIISSDKKNYGPIDFGGLVEDVIADLGGTRNYEAMNFNLKVLVREAFYYNKELLTVLFHNLIQNSIKFSKPSSQDFQPKISIEITSVQNNIQIIIKDNGKGIPQEHMDKIFDLNYGVEDDNISRVGIGLYLVKKIVDTMNGKLNYSSESLKGTCFKILLPKLNKQT